MKLAKRNTTLIAMTLACALSIGGALTFSQLSKTNFLKKVAASTYTIALNSSTEISGLSSTASSGTFVTTTESGNSVHWSYSNAKSNASGFITLARSYVGNSIGDEGFIMNTDPITSLESIQVVYSGTDNYLTFYGSIDGSNYERVVTITSSGTVSELNKYFYFKIASGEQTKQDLNITSLTFTYACTASDFVKDSRDAINSNTTFSSDGDLQAASIQTTEVFDSNRSSSGLVWTNNLSNKYKYAFLYLPREYTAAELAHSTFVMHVKPDNVTLSGTSSTFIVDFYKDSWSTKTMSSSFYPWYNTSNSTWQTLERDLSTSTFTDGVNRVRICANDIVTGGSLYVDDIYFYEQSSYPTFTYDYTASADEKDDLINAGISNGSSTIVGDYSYNHFSTKGDRSLKIYMNSGYNWANITNLYNVDLTGKTVEFDYYHETDEYVYFGYLSGTETYYYEDISKTRTGTTVTNVIGLDGLTWKHVVIDIDALSAGGHVSKKTGSSNSSYQGIRHISAEQTTYVDNLYVF